MHLNVQINMSTYKHKERFLQMVTQNLYNDKISPYYAETIESNVLSVVYSSYIHIEFVK